MSVYTVSEPLLSELALDSEPGLLIINKGSA